MQPALPSAINSKQWVSLDRDLARGRVVVAGSSNLDAAADVVSQAQRPCGGAFGRNSLYYHHHFGAGCRYSGGGVGVNTGVQEW